MTTLSAHRTPRFHNQLSVLLLLSFLSVQVVVPLHAGPASAGGILPPADSHCAIAAARSTAQCADGTEDAGTSQCGHRTAAHDACDDMHTTAHDGCACDGTNDSADCDDGACTPAACSHNCHHSPHVSFLPSSTQNVSNPVLPLPTTPAQSLLPGDITVPFLPPRF